MHLNSIVYFIDGQLIYDHTSKDVAKDPEMFPVRKKKDLFTKELGLAIVEKFFTLTGDNINQLN